MFLLRGTYAKLGCVVCFSGTIVKVGTNITRFKPGDRIVTNSCGTIRNDARFGAYQRYALTSQELTAKVSQPVVQLWLPWSLVRTSAKITVDDITF
jgi:hypothetical protein